MKGVFINSGNFFWTQPDVYILDLMIHSFIAEGKTFLLDKYCYK